MNAQGLLDRYAAGQRDFTEVDLSFEFLDGSYLAGANLRRANLRNASLRGVILRNSILNDANLEGAKLTGADLTRTALIDAKIDLVELRKADLSAIAGDFLLRARQQPNELSALLDALKAGKIDGTCCDNDCGDLIETIAAAAGVPPYELKIERNICCPAERFFEAIQCGDTPETNPVSAIAADWTERLIQFRGRS